MPLACVIFNMSSCVPSAENFASTHSHYLAIPSSRRNLKFASTHTHYHAIPSSRRDLKRETRRDDFIADLLALWAALAVVLVLLISSYNLIQKKFFSVTVAFA